LRSSDGYSEVKSEVQEIENRLKELNPTEYQNTNENSLNQQAENEGLNDTNIDEETKKAMDDAKKFPTTENKNKAEELIQQNGAKNKLENVLNEIEVEIENGDLDDAKKNELMLKLIATANQNEYMKMAAQKLKDRIEALKSKLKGNEIEGEPTQEPSSRLPGGAVALIVVSAVGIIAIIGALLLRKKRLKRRK